MMYSGDYGMELRHLKYVLVLIRRADPRSCNARKIGRAGRTARGSLNQASTFKKKTSNKLITLGAPFMESAWLQRPFLVSEALYPGVGLHNARMKR